MYLTKASLISFTLFFLFTGIPSAGSAQLEYQNRGNRYEGIKPKPVSGYDIELISARMDYKEEAPQKPDRLKLKFYLEQPSPVYLTVRELDNKYYYWMDKVQPPKPWRQGFYNDFDWPTQDVLGQLDQITMYDLGVVARLEKPEPGKVERVAPAIFYYSKFPSQVKGYLFTFKTNGDAKLTCSFYKEGETKPVFTRTLPRQHGGKPFTVRWDSSGALEGSYKLVVKGYFLANSDPIDQTLYFYHQPVVQ